MSWRYQPVWVKHEKTDLVSYSLAEVYLDKDGKLKSWTADPVIAPHGNDLNDLQGSLALMISDAFKWEPVEHRKLRVGMRFKKR